MLTKAAFIWSKIQSVLRWPRELNALQIDKAPAKKKKKKIPHQFDNTHAANAHNKKKSRNVANIII